MKTDLYIFDLDGTLANLEHRLHHIMPPAKKNWPAFFDACDKDEPINWVIHITEIIHQVNGYILILSGRMNHVRAKTQAWLLRHNIKYDLLLMRGENDFRDDTIVKWEIFKDFIQGNRDMALRFIVDDRQRVVDMWRSHGLPVLQCAAWEEIQGTYEKE